ncbi:NAD(P)H-dependent glycerol-3-phosphate dehydrogenase [Tumebacillus sp. ITR2]|uniref:Glycerol-3-phosphate dehydrogenase [NAD(P)+] n=1 Tax=Tumebacillus amylolyticus TaxID=2801339 RepID=A0ABS1JCP0_9BACL|nr:NAD(P)H-dependent glycerol-3-phosphate dehydrogenase [Tumebacillus amylolyticus]MBL0387814.1 NAD(P)H-dependent glycerol-3-phosphate dehydrogenase [Tumebacillus amylolyticus]
MTQRVAVIGAGSFGTALAQVLADKGCLVDIYARREDQVREINENHTNSRYLPDVTLHEGIRASSDLQAVLNGTPYVLIVMPSSAFRETVQLMRPYLDPHAFVAHATKGFDVETGQRMTQIMEEELSEHDVKKFAVVTGPSHAEELSRRIPTTIVVASRARATAEAFQDLLMTSYLRLYTNPDVVGTELGGTLKNIIALGVGFSDGLGFGDNAKAALMTRGLTEISRLGMHLGAAQLTFGGLAGVGDLIATCTSKHSRNWRAGYALGQGKSLDQVLNEMGMVVEGVRATKGAYNIARQTGVDMPITTAIYQVLFEGKAPKAAVEELMGRRRIHEMEEVAEAIRLDWQD